MRRVSVFGATGSIGVNTIDLLSRQGGPQEYEVVALTGGRNIALLAEQARATRAQIAVTAHEDEGPALRDALAGTQTKVLAGPQALIEAAQEPVDWAMSAIVGAAGLEPTMAMARSARVVALANKETMVCAGSLFRAAAAQSGAIVLPVDSEHSAIFQSLSGDKRSALRKILLTGSGGPFRTWPAEKIAGATLKNAMTHPNWSMGQRITIDSASMFNKALEMIEAKELFDVAPDQIEVVVHPQSIVHSMVEFTDGAVIAQLGAPDMRGPIGYALNYPDRAPLPVEPLDFAALSRLDFEAPDPVRFPSLRLARETMETGGAAGAVLNAAKEVALDAFIEERIAFPAMAEVVAQTLDTLAKDAGRITPADGLKAILVLDAEARAVATAQVQRAAPRS